jgi:hypothetical protein
MVQLLQNISKGVAFVFLPRRVFKIAGHTLRAAGTARLLERALSLLLFCRGDLNLFLADIPQPPHQGSAKQSRVARLFIKETQQVLLALVQSILLASKLGKLPFRQTMQLRLHGKNALNSAETISHMLS